MTVGLGVRIGHCRASCATVRRTSRVIELVDLLVECDAVLGEKVTPGNDRVFVEVDVLDDEHELFVGDDRTARVASTWRCVDRGRPATCPLAGRSRRLDSSRLPVLTLEPP